MDIRSVDLNLLPVLDALLRHRSATLAARELDMSQSALSSALARLRKLLGDELFVRTGRGLMPTPRASALADVVAGIVDQVRDRILHSSAFDAATTQRSFRVLLSDVGAYVLLPRIARALKAEAPGAGLTLRPLTGADIATDLAEGKTDLAIGSYPDLPESLFQRRLFERHFVALLRADHPLARRRLTMRAFADAPQLVVRMTSGIQERVDAALAPHGLARRHTLELPSYLMLPPLLEATDHLAVVPGQLAEAFAQAHRFALLDLPMPLPPSTIRLYWHRRFQDDAGNAWLRDLVVRELGDG